MKDIYKDYKLRTEGLVANEYFCIFEGFTTVHRSKYDNVIGFVKLR